MNRRHVLSSLCGASASMLAFHLVPSSAWAASFSNTDAISALRAALSKGADVAVSQLGAADGFLGNDKVRIGLPDMLEKASPILRTMGRGKQLDELISAMNHAAEQSVALARPLLADAIKSMSIQDAQNILQGGDNAVTQYFATKTRAPLTRRFQPVVNQVVDKLAVTRSYNELAGKASAFGVVKGSAMTVQDHVTAKALDALYFVIGEEERRIRRDPVGTGSAILKKVFGAL
ncbi:DUF4197 domain-containing protein [Aquabacterium sp.]|uniref:DUF4197 domain-containing protein n=1 Tax=Aquabacterium sp. TaxID=1872578 RepID=UPI003B6BC904